jgi:O-antigen/teichoic acid export membrane protein
VVIGAAALTLSASGVAFLSVAISVTNFLNFAISAVDSSYGPRIARAMTSGNRAHLSRLLASSVVMKLAGVIAGGILLLLFGRPILGLFGPEYVQALPLLSIFMILPLTNALFGPSILLLNISGISSPVFFWTGGGIALMVALISLGGVVGGMTGAAIGTAAGYFVMQAGLFFASVARTGIDASIRAAFARRGQG